MPSANTLCNSTKNTMGADPLPKLCGPGDLTDDQSRPPQAVSGALTESPRASAAVETAGSSSPSPPVHSEGACEHELLVYISRDTCTDLEDPPRGPGAAAEDSPSPPVDKIPENHSEGGPEQSNGEKCEENKAGQKVPDHSPVKEKISILRKVDRGHYRNRRERSSSGERTRESGSQPAEHYHRKRHSSVRERAGQERYRTQHCDGGQPHPCPSQRLSPGEHRSLGRYGRHHSRSRGAADREWGRYHHSESEHSWGREKHYPDRLRWDKCRYYHDRYAPYAAREAREWKPFHGPREYAKAGPYGGRPYKDYYRGRKGYEPVAKGKDRHHFGSPRAGPPHALLPYPEKYPHEKIALVAEDTNCNLADRFHEHENAKSRKRRYDSVENSDGHVEKKAWRGFQKDPLEEPKVKKHKKSKKKKKSKDKHRGRDSR